MTATATAAVLLLLLSLLPSSLSVGEDVHLLKFKDSLKDSSPLDSTWIKDTNPCDRRKPWRGVDCTDTGFKTVSALLLMNLGLSGDGADMDIEALANLQSLRVVSLEKNAFSGSIPQFNRLTSVKSLFLSSNRFSGEIPPDFFTKMESLKKLHVQSNSFAGKIPDSLRGLDNLMEMMLQKNEFSGPIPEFEQQSLQIIDLSYNKLEGEIPSSMSRFPAKAFEGNPSLCGALISTECKPAEAPPAEKKSPDAHSGNSSNTKWVVLAVVVAMLMVTIMFRAKKKDQESFRVLGKENVEEVVQVHVPSSMNRRSSSSNRRGGDYNEAGSRSSKRGSRPVNDLVVINQEYGVFGLADLMKAAAEVLGSGGMGSAYKATMGNGLSVVVKRMRDMNKLSRDAFESEIRKLGRIRHRNILPPLAYHFRKEEKLLVTQFIPKGSLLFLLHGDRGTGHSELDWGTRLKIIKGVGRGMGFLHTEFAHYELPHGNLKSCNILLSDNYEPLLTDYALHPLISNAQSVQALFAYKSPEAVLYQQLYPKSDVFCLGIVILEIMTGKFPSQYLNNQKGGTDVVQWVRQAISERRLGELIDPEIILNNSNSIDQMEKMLHIGATCTKSDAETRIEMREAIRSIEEVEEEAV
ncbi:hypothetical protein ACS0TY_021547 [Phlomoides rotata]